MTDDARITDLGHGFWNIRGDLRIGGILNVGAQSSLVRLSDGGFVMIDACEMDRATRDTVMTLTDQGKGLRAVLYVHPFHTLHCADVHAMFPLAAHYGCARHRRLFPDLPWQDETVDSATVVRRLAPDLELSVPQGMVHVDDDDSIHAWSVLVRHPASRSVHVDDTLNVLPVPSFMRRLLGWPVLSFHPTTAKALDNGPDNVDAFLNWARSLAKDWGDTRHVCAAHTRRVTLEGPCPLQTAMTKAITQIEPKLRKAARR